MKAALFALLLLGLHIVFDPFLSTLRGKSLDFYQSLLADPATTDGLVIVGIDDAALAREGRWPWSRAKIAALIEAIGTARPAAFGIDILFVDEGPAADEALLAASIARHRPVLAISIGDYPATGSVQPHAGWSVVGADGAGSLPVLPGLLASRPAFSDVAGGLGVVRSIPDTDGVTRSIPLVWATNEGDERRFWPAMALELARQSLGEPGYVVRLNAGGYDALKLGQLRVPLSAAGALFLTDSRAPIPRIGALGVLDGLASEALVGKIVILSVTATGFDSFHTTPLVATRPGADVHALLTGQILSGRFPVALADARTYERLFFSAAAALMIGAMLLLAERRFALLCAFTVLSLAPLAAGVLAYQVRDQIFDWLQPFAGLVALSMLATHLLYRKAEERRQRISLQFARYLSPKVVETLIRSNGDVIRSAERRLVTVVFLDMRGYTLTSETRPPSEVVDTVNRFLTIASEEIFRTDGTIDKFMGDAVMAFWNAPLDQTDHASRALATVEAIFLRLETENALRQTRGERALQIGAGLETGDCSVGNFGSDIRFNFTVIGGPVNLAARLEQATKTAGHRVLTGPGFAAVLPGAVAPAGEFTLAGYAQPVKAYVPHRFAA